jgi:hypothetical protein
MKYYKELSEIENEIIRLDTVQSMLRIVADGVMSSREQDVQHSLWFITDEIENVNEKLSENFQNVWDQVRDDSFETKSEYLKVTDYKSPSKASTELNDIVNSWVR